MNEPRITRIVDQILRMPQDDRDEIANRLREAEESGEAARIRAERARPSTEKVAEEKGWSEEQVERRKAAIARSGSPLVSEVGATGPPGTTGPSGAGGPGATGAGSTRATL